MRLIFCCFVFLFNCTTLFAQQDSVAAAKTDTAKKQAIVPAAPDSAAISKERRDQFVADSLAMKLLIPDSLRENKFTQALVKNPFVSIDSLLINTQEARDALLTGQLRNSRDPWIIIAILGLLIYTALLNVFLGKDIRNVLQSFYNKRAISQADMEDGAINFWAFVGLFILFSLTLALVLYQIMTYYGVPFFNLMGMQLFIALTMVISLLFALKFFILKFIGYVFDVNTVVSEYISILNLTYFNIAFVLLFLAVCLSLISAQYFRGILVLTLVAIGVIFAWQYVRNSLGIISNFRFHKFYLFVYLCALEICPVLVLVKALSI